MNRVLKSLTPQSQYGFDLNDQYSLTQPENSGWVETFKAASGISYGSMLFEYDSHLQSNLRKLYQESPDEFNALASSDPFVVEELNNLNNRAIKEDLIFAKDLNDFKGIIEEKNNRLEQHKILENSSLFTYGTVLLADPINGAAIIFPVLKSKSVWDAMRKSALMTTAIVGPLETGRVYSDPLVKPIEGVATTGMSVLFSSVLTGAGRGISDYFTNRARKEIYNQVTSEMVATGTFKPDGIYRDSNGMLHGNFTENVTIARSSGKSIFDTPEEELTKIFKNFSYNKIITNQAKVDEHFKKEFRNLKKTILGTYDENTGNVYLDFEAIKRSYKKFKNMTKGKAAIQEYKRKLKEALDNKTVKEESYYHHMNKIKHIDLLNNVDEYAKLILLHELHHTTNPQLPRESRGLYENRIDNLALHFLRDERSISEYSVFRDGVKTKINPDDIPVLDNPNSFDTSGSGAFLNSWAYKAIPTPYKNFIMNKAINDDVKELMHKLGSDMGMKQQKNALGIPSDFSVHIKSNTDHGKWVRVYDDIMKIYSEDTNKKVTGVLDYRIWGAKTFDDWMKNVNRRMVFNDLDGATAGEKKAIKLFQTFWKEWEQRLIDVNMIGTRRGLINEIARLEIRLKELEATPAIKGDLDYNKLQIERYKGKLDELRSDLSAKVDTSVPQNEMSFYARYWNHDMILANKEKFTQILEKWYAQNPYIYEKGVQKLLSTNPTSVRSRAEETVSKILGETDGNFEQSFAGYSSKHTRHRNLNIPNKLVWEFIEQNPISVMKNYTTRVSPEYHFKNDFNGRSLEEVQEFIYNSVSKSSNVKSAQKAVMQFTHMYDRVVGNVVKDPTKLNQRVRQVLSDLAGLTYLGSAGFATLTDYAAIALQREAGAWLKLIFSTIDGQKISLNAKEGRYAGEALDILKNMEGLRLIDDLSNRTIDRGLYSKVAGKAKQLFYSTNLLGPATNLAKRLESIFRAHQIIEDAISIQNKTASKQTVEMMAKMGFGIKEIEEIAKKAPYERNTPKGLYLANSDGWLKAGVSRETLDKFRNSMNAGIFNTVIMASPADKPIMMDGVFYVPWRVAKYIPGMKESKSVRGYSRIENGLFSLPFAFMSYSFGAANKITASLAQNTLKNKAMGFTMAMGLAYMGLQLRYRNRPYVLENMSTEDKIARTFDYSGLAAIYSDMFYRGISIGTNLGYFENSPVNPKFISKDKTERPMDAALEVIGAPASLLWEYKRGVVDFYNGEVNEGVKRFQRNLPFAKIWWMENLSKDIGKVVGRW